MIDSNETDQATDKSSSSESALKLLLCVGSALLPAIEENDSLFKEGKISAADKMAGNIMAITEDYFRDKQA